VFLCLRVPENIAKYATVGDAPPKWHPVIKVSVKTSSHVAVKQMSSMYHLVREPVFKPRIPVLLNQNPESWPIIDPTACNPELRDSGRRHFLSKVLTDGDVDHGCAFTLEQQTNIKSAYELRGGLMLVVGPGGSGESATQLALSKLYNLCGLHTIHVCPTNVSTSHLRKEHDKVFAKLAKKDPNLRALQVAPIGKEQNHFYFAGLQRPRYAIENLDENGIDIAAITKEEGDINSMFYSVKKSRATRSLQIPSMVYRLACWKPSVPNLVRSPSCSSIHPRNRCFPRSRKSCNMKFGDPILPSQ
jgi:hypothetical protein